MIETPPPPPEVPYVTVIIGRNAPTRRSILITPPKGPFLDQPPSSQPSSSSQPPSRTSSSTTASSALPASTDGGEDATPDTTRPSSFESFKEDTVCDLQQETRCQSPEEGEDALMEQRLNVKFAPLPDVGPRKRRGAPLGVAARSRMVRRRRSRSVEGGASPQAVSSMWTEEEIEEQRARLARAWEKEREKRDYYNDVDENGDPVEDPITAFGRLVKVAGKQLWNKMASREAKESSRVVKDRKGKSTRKNSLNKKHPDSDDHPPQHRARSASAPPESDRISSPISDDNEETHDDTSQGSSEEVGPHEIPQENDPTTRKKVFPWSRTRLTKGLSPVLRSKSFTGGTPPATSKRSRSSDMDDVARTAQCLTQDEDKQESTAGLRRSMSI